MATYHWNPVDMRDVFVLPAALVDTALGLATSEQVKVLLWFSRHHQQWDAVACADAIGEPPAVCESHLQFWVQQGLLQSEAEEPMAAPVVKTPVSRPPMVKPQLGEVLEYQKAHPDFGPFLDAAAAHLGKALSHGDVATLLYLLTTAGLPENVILLEIAYAVSLGKANMRYIEKLALAWADEDLTTYERVDEHIRDLQRQQESAARVEAVLQLPRSLTAAQMKLADKWVTAWGFSDQMLQHAQTRTVEKCEKTNLNYMDKILESWYEEGIRQPEQIPQPYQKKSGVAATNPETSSLDMDGFEKQLRQYRPKYQKKDQ